MFHSPGPMGLIIIAAVVLVLFGRGKVSNLMGEVGKGISSFKKGIKDGADDLEREEAAAKELPAATVKDKA